MGNLKKYIIPLLILFLLTSLVVVFRSFLMTNVIEPVALLFWAVWRIVSSVDQNIYWVVLIFFCIYLIIRLIPSKTDNLPNSADDFTFKSLDRVESWQTLIRDAALGKNESEILQDRLKELYWTVSAEAEWSDSHVSNENKTLSQTSLPLAVQRYLYPSSGKQGMFSKMGQNISYLVPRPLRRWARINIYKDYALVDEILGLMETELEINHEK